MKNVWKKKWNMIGFWMLKPSKTMPCAMNSWFSPFQKKSESRCQNASQICWKMDQNPPQGRPGSTYPSILSILDRVEKRSFFRWDFGSSKSRPKSAPGRPRVDFSATTDRRGFRFRSWGSPGRHLFACGYNSITIKQGVERGSDTPWADGPANYNFILF